MLDNWMGPIGPLANLELRPIAHECVRDGSLTYGLVASASSIEMPADLYTRDLVLHFLDPLARNGLSKRWQLEEL